MVSKSILSHRCGKFAEGRHVWLGRALLFPFVMFALCLLNGPSKGQVLLTYVSGSGTDGNPCTLAKPCKTLQGALAKTAPAGQIYALDSANYGYVNVNKAVSIIGAHGVAGVLAPSSVTGVAISAGPNDAISLQGLEIDGAGAGTDGIRFSSGASLNIRDSVIRGFTNGINFQPSGPSAILVDGALIVNNSTGIAIQSAVPSSGIFNDVQVVSNANGIIAAGAGETSKVNLTIQTSVIANNGTVG